MGIFGLKTNYLATLLLMAAVRVTRLVEFVPNGRLFMYFGRIF
jgi:hypothetical protein